MSSRAVTSTILAGGRSTRMGTDKGLLRLSPGGPTMVETVAARLAEAGLPPPLLVTNSPQDYAFLGLPMLPDDVPGAGPLGGILTALNHSASPRVLVVACDMPLLSVPLLRYMASLPTEADALVPRRTTPAGGVRVEPMHAIYSTACLPAVRQRIEAGRLKLAGLLEDVQVEYIDEGVLRRYDPRLDSLRNVNTPEEWEEYVTCG